VENVVAYVYAKFSDDRSLNEDLSTDNNNNKNKNKNNVIGT